MTDEMLKALLPALDLAAFERRADGSFSSVAPRPTWFARLVADPTFPFLGHILEEANQFWRKWTPGRHDWGPVAEVDEAGQEFHYKVTALTVENKQYLIFHLDPGSDEMRTMLQHIREQKLADEQNAGAMAKVRKQYQRDALRTAQEFRGLLGQVPGAAAPESRAELGRQLEAKYDELLQALDALVQTAHRAQSRS